MNKEIAFKWLFAIEGKAIPKIHYIDELAYKLSLPEEVINDVADLTADYTFARFEALKGRYKAVENE